MGSLGCSFGVCGGDVVHGGAAADAEQPHEVERVRGESGFVADAVLADVRHGQTEFGGAASCGDTADLRTLGVESGLRGNHQMWVRGGWPADVAFAEPVGGDPLCEWVDLAAGFGQSHGYAVGREQRCHGGELFSVEGAFA